MYANGKGVKRNYKEAVKLLKLAKVSIRLFKRLKIGELPFQGVSFRFKTPCFGSRGSEVQILSPRPFKTRT